MKKISVWLSDLTHTAQGISAATFPLGVSFVYSYSKKMLGDEFDFELFKFPSHLAEALNNSHLLCLVSQIIVGTLNLHTSLPL
jgi:hypothetical protein